ncbi:anti-anti-sigma factor [Sphaerochaeta pleomorpha str. Grapes]|uniref:Anti-sigma factor antagonist n=1 Tax=Sphaerochaeta pleomorpha (strain ATCC BAA-1885 / DSM 22778 / Grapes) TaxID=158190 RepID=G8QS99_SPHPG|nr:STAS domain-containing protein [Sphaerochaeta pleomorpha]AEV30029.1 anti-anti-sigma factor [Sphaerochaeta pleomorpha str. Grapes]
MIATKEAEAMVIEVESTTLTAANAKEFKAALEPYLDAEMNIVINLNRVTFLDSSGLGIFLFCLKKLNQKGGDVKLCNVTKPVRVLFELVRLHQIIEVFNTKEEALASFSHT